MDNPHWLHPLEPITDVSTMQYVELDEDYENRITLVKETETKTATSDIGWN